MHDEDDQVAVAPPRPTRLDRAKVLEAACVIVDREGFEGLSLTGLATELDRHVSSLYNHVEGLDGLRRDVTRLALGELGDRLWRSVLGKSGPDGLRALADAYRGFATDSPGKFYAATTWHERLPRSEAGTVGRPAGDAIHAVMASFGLEGTAIVHATRSFATTMVGFITAAGRTFEGPPDRDDTFDALIDLFVRALTETEWLRGDPA